MRELGLEVPEEPEALREYARLIAREILEGQVEAAEGVKTVWRLVVARLDYPEDLAPWADLGMDLDPSTRIPFADAAAGGEAIRAWCATFLERDGYPREEGSAGAG